MPRVAPEKIRCFAVVGHGHSGKTTLVESMLFNAGVVPRPGRVEDGTTRTDSDPEEIARKLTIHATPATFNWQGTEIDAVDCPGYADFSPEVKGVLDGLDAALVCVSAAAGCEAQTEKSIEAARELSEPVLVVVTKMDKEHADFDAAVASLEEACGGHFVPVWFPIGEGEAFEGIVDLLVGKAYHYRIEGSSIEERPVPDALAERVARYREKLIEAAIEIDDALTERYLAGESIPDADLRAVVRKAIVTGHFVPVFCCAGSRNIAVRHLLDALVQYVPAASECERTARTNDGQELHYRTSPDGDPLAYCFKVLHEPHVGDVALVRVLNGTLSHGMPIYNTTRHARDKIGALYRVVGRDRQEVSELTAGQVGAVVKMHAIHANESLAAEKHPLLHPPVQYPEPSISSAVRPATQADQEKLATILTRLGQEEPCIRAFPDPVTHEIIFSAMGDLQLESFVHRIQARHHIKLEMAKPRIPYRETIRATAEAEGKIKKQTGGHGQFAVVNLRVEPNPGKGFEFVDAIVGGVVPRNFIPAVEKGLREALPRGVIAGYPVTDLKVTLYYGKYHDVDSSEMAFKSAAAHGLKDAVRAAKPVLLEPIMRVSIAVPESSMGDILADLNHRRGRVQGLDPVGRKMRIKALVPLSEMYRYVTPLRSMTMGRGEFEMTHDHYDEVPQQLASGILADWKGNGE